MKDQRKASVAAGILILVAYIVVASFFFDSALAVLAIELIGGASVVALAFVLYPFLRRGGKALAASYAIVKTAEGLVLIAAALLLFSSLITQQTYDLVQLNHMYIFALAFLLLSYSLYKSKLVPRFISIWGMAGSVLMMMSAVNIIVPELLPQYVTHLPVIVNELLLAVWLIVKGFRK